MSLSLINHPTSSIIRPNMSYAVYNLTKTICHSGYFLASSTMGDTLGGLIHTLMTDVSISNTSRKRSNHIFRRMIIFYHMALVRNMIELDGNLYFTYIICFYLCPSDPAHEHAPVLANMDSVMDVLAACVIGIFINILEPETYCFPISDCNISDADRELFKRDDFNAMCKMDRMACTYVRGLSWSILQWLDETLILWENNRKVDFLELMNTVLLSVCGTLCTYKMKCVDEGEGCTPLSLKRQLNGLFNEDTIIRSRFDNEYRKPPGATTDFNTSAYTVERREVILPHQYNFSVESMLRLGLNPSDRLYYSSIYGDIDTMMDEIKQSNEGE